MNARENRRGNREWTYQRHGRAALGITHRTEKTKAQHRKCKRLATRTLQQTGDVSKCSRWVRSSCFLYAFFFEVLRFTYVTDRMAEPISVYVENVLIRNAGHTCLKTSTNERRQTYFEKINIFINYFSSFLVNDKSVFQEAY